MKRTKNEKFALAVVMALALSLPLLSSAVYAVPGSTLKVNGKLNGTLETPYGPMPDTIVIELKAKGDGSSFVAGSGSLHGINCGATFFFDALTVTSVGHDKIVFEGPVTGSNTPASGFIEMGTSIVFETSLSGDHMTLTINVNGLGEVFHDSTGSGKVVL